MPKYLQHGVVRKMPLAATNYGKMFCSISQIFCGVLKCAGRFHRMLINIPEYLFQLFINIL